MDIQFLMTYGGGFVLGLVVLIVGAVLIGRASSSSSGSKKNRKWYRTFPGKVFGAVCFYFITWLGSVVIGAPALDHVLPWMWDFPAGAGQRLVATPLFYTWIASGSLFVLLPDRFAISRYGRNYVWVVFGGLGIITWAYALGWFPPPEFWDSQSVNSLHPGLQAFLKWIYPPIYP